MAWLACGDASAKRAVLGAGNLVGATFKGLGGDSVEVRPGPNCEPCQCARCAKSGCKVRVRPPSLWQLVDAVFAAVLGHVVLDATVTRAVRLGLLSGAALQQLAKLYERRTAPAPAVEDEGDDAPAARTIADAVHDFLLKACCVRGQGICFPDRG